MAVTGNEPLSTGDLLAVMQAAQTGAFSRCATLQLSQDGSYKLSGTGITVSGRKVTLPDGVYALSVIDNSGDSGNAYIKLDDTQLAPGTYYLSGGTYDLSSGSNVARVCTIVQVGGGGGQLLASLIAAMGGGAA